VHWNLYCTKVHF